MSNNDPTLDELRQQTEATGDRLDTTAPEQTFIDALETYLEDDETPSSRKNLTVNDPDLWAVFQAFDHNDDRYREFLQRVGISSEDPARSQVLSSLVRYAIRDLDPQLKQEIDDAKGGF